MCGIAGMIRSGAAPLNSEVIQDFTNAIRHRGPDSSGFYLDDELPFAMGHRRLAILDLSQRASQPMRLAGTDLVIVYNGEIFNFIEIRLELENQGYKFLTNSDTEIILAAYHRWGADCLKKFNGMWAFAIWNEKTKRLFLARDRFGVKPLYYLHVPNKIFAFASETIAFLHLDGFRREFDSKLLAANIQDAFALEGRGYTIFKDILQLLPGHFMEIDARQPLVQQRRWWNTLDNLPAVAGDYLDQVSAFRDLFHDSTRLRLRSDVPIATALSGGVDSSAVYCMLKQIAKEDSASVTRRPKDWQRAFIATFPGARIDEKSYAEEVLSFTGGEGQFIVPNETELVEQIRSSTLKFDSIYLTPMMVVSNIYRAMHDEGYKISLDGHGVDEMLLGYPQFAQMASNEASRNGQEALAEEYWQTYANLYPLDLQPSRVQQNASRESRTWQTLLKSKHLLRKMLVLCGLKTDHSWFSVMPSADLPQLSDQNIEYRRLGVTDAALYEAFHLTILPTILRNFDRASMQHSIEVRMPFMDYRIVTFVFALPLASKIGGGYTKRVLRDAMTGIMPETIRTRKLKIGLNAPIADWFNGPLAEYILDTIGSKRFRDSSIWNGNTVARFAYERTVARNWNWQDAERFWPVLNAHILISS